jgi:predicted nucleotidyltransferase
LEYPFLLKKWSDIEAVGLYGSVVRGEDAQWSDLDMICIVKSTSGKDDLFFIYQGLPIWVEVWSKPYILEKIQEPEPVWPIHPIKEKSTGYLRGIERLRRR